MCQQIVPSALMVHVVLVAGKPPWQPLVCTAAPKIGFPAGATNCCDAPARKNSGHFPLTANCTEPGGPASGSGIVIIWAAGAVSHCGSFTTTGCVVDVVVAPSLTVTLT